MAPRTLTRTLKGSARHDKELHRRRYRRLSIEGLENRIVFATLNLQYNVELQTHHVAFGYDHLSVLLTPQNPSLYNDADGDTFADVDPLFVRRSDGSFALSLGAGPASNNPISPGNLISAFNREFDIDPALHPPTNRHTLLKPAGFADSREWANALISRSAGYGDNILYKFFPDATDPGRNSNSFIAGLLNATGTIVADPATIFSDGDYPGYATPVPTAAFGTAAAPRIDLVFVVDTTGSMGDDIAAVKSSATAIIDDINTRFRVDQSLDARIAVMDYRDFPVSPYGAPGDYPFNDVQRFTSNATTARSGIQALSLGNGANIPESVFSGLMHAIQSPSLGSWRGPGVSKIIIQMGDAPGHDPEPFTGYTTSTVINAAINEDPVVVFPVAIGSFNSSQLLAIANGTGGRLIPTANASTIVSAILTAIGTVARSPVAEANGPYSAFVGERVVFSAVGSADPDGTIVRYEWDWDGDGTYDESSTLPTAEHTWTSPYSGMVRLRVHDNEGLTSIDTAHVDVTYTKLEVEKGATQRSHIQHLDLLFASPTGLEQLINDGKVKLTRYGLDGSGGVDVDLTGKLRAVGSRIEFDFGANGIGGDRNSTIGDGHYKIGLNLDANPDFETDRYFYRLLGDTNGDRVVNSTDINAIRNGFGRSGSDLEEDVNGDGFVTALDRILTMRSNNRALATGLRLDD